MGDEEVEETDLPTRRRTPLAVAAEEEEQPAARPLRRSSAAPVLTAPALVRNHDDVDTRPQLVPLPAATPAPPQRPPAVPLTHAVAALEEVRPQPEPAPTARAEVPGGPAGSVPAPPVPDAAGGAGGPVATVDGPTAGPAVVSAVSVRPAPPPVPPDGGPAVEPEKADAPSVYVTIGRVEVRASVSPPAPAARGPEEPSVLPLDEYLRRRTEAGRR